MLCEFFLKNAIITLSCDLQKITSIIFAKTSWNKLRNTVTSWQVQNEHGRSYHKLFLTMVTSLSAMLKHFGPYWLHILANETIGMDSQIPKTQEQLIRQSATCTVQKKHSLKWTFYRPCCSQYTTPRRLKLHFNSTYLKVTIITLYAPLTC